MLSISVSDNNIKECYEILLLNDPNYKEIYLNPEKINPRTAKAILRALEQNTSITKLIIYFLDFDFFQACVNALSNNNSIQSLDLIIPTTANWHSSEMKKLAEGLNFKNNKPNINLSVNIYSEDIINLSNELKGNKSIVSLTLHKNNDILSKQTVTTLLDFLTTTSIHSLTLDSYKITNDAIVTLAEAIEKNNLQLKEFSLKNTYALFDNKIIILSKSIEKNKSIQVLDLSNNLIGDEGAIALAEAIKNNKSVKALNLSNNLIGDEGAIVLANALLRNSSLTQFDLLENSEITLKGKTAVIGALHRNPFILNISYPYNIDEDAKKILKHISKRNAKIAETKDLWKKANLIWSLVHGQSRVPSLQNIAIYTIVNDKSMDTHYLNCKTNDEVLAFINEARNMTTGKAQLERKSADELSDSEIKRPHNIAQTLSYKSDLDVITAITPNEAKNSSSSIENDFTCK